MLRFYKKKIVAVGADVQIFLLSRLDFGTFIYHSYYARCWTNHRGKTALVLLTSRMSQVKQLAQLISPDSTLICLDNRFFRIIIALFRPGKYQQVIFNSLFSRLQQAYPQALYIFDALPRSEFHPYFDWRLAATDCTIFSPSFLQAYQKTRRVMDSRDSTLRDSFELHRRDGLASRRMYLPAMTALRKAIGLQKEYVVLNINAKKYRSGAENNRSVEFPQRYDAIIDELIAQGLLVVIQGRSEQPQFNPRKGLVDYTRSHFTSIQNDLLLYSHCYFAITNKTGPESFCTVCNTPQLGLNYAEISSIIHNIKCRFWPKKFYSKHMQRALSWREVLKSPSYFDLGPWSYDQDIIYEDLEEEELLSALKEFLSLAPQSDEKWLEWTPEQKEFHQALSPIHLDLHDTLTVPCQAYLNLYRI